MKRHFNWMLITLFALSMLSPAVTLADSYYSIFGLGLPSYSVSPQAAGMGEVGIGVRQFLSLNEMNPAAVNLMGNTAVTLSYRFESIDNKYNDETVNTRQGNAAGFAMGVPIMDDRMALIARVKPNVGAQYTFAFQNDIFLEDTAFERRVTGSGGVSSASGGMQFTATSWLSVGALFNYYFGAYQEIWKTDFASEQYVSTKDDITNHIYGRGVEFGIALRPLEQMTLGLHYRPQQTLTIDTEMTLGLPINAVRNVGGHEVEVKDQSVDYPQSIGVGLSYQINKVLVAVDYYQQDWRDYTREGRTNDRLAQFWRVGGGAEYVQSWDPLARYGKRISYRLGGYYAQLPILDLYGDPVTEQFITAGIGFPFKGERGRIDFAVQAGVRNSTDQADYSERIIRVTGSLTGAEKWFQSIFR